MRRFILIEMWESTHLSGVGITLEGVQLSDGKCFIYTGGGNFCLFEDMDTLMENRYNYEKRIKIEWLDE